jgi:hypothetical protein
LWLLTSAAVPFTPLLPLNYLVVASGTTTTPRLAIYTQKRVISSSSVQSTPQKELKSEVRMKRLCPFLRFRPGPLHYWARCGGRFVHKSLTAAVTVLPFNWLPICICSKHRYSVQGMVIPVRSLCCAVSDRLYHSITVLRPCSAPINNPKFDALTLQS